MGKFHVIMPCYSLFIHGHHSYNLQSSYSFPFIHSLFIALVTSPPGINLSYKLYVISLESKNKMIYF